MRTGAAVMVFGLIGCSFIASTTPNGGTHSCMRNRLPPIVDTAVVVGAPIVDIAARTCHSGGFGCLGIDVVAIAATIIAVPYLVSAIYGYSKDRCPRDPRAL